MDKPFGNKPPTINLADTGFETLPNEKYYNIITLSGAVQTFETVEKTAWWYIGKDENKSYYFSKVGWFYRSGSGYFNLFDPTYMTLFAFYRAPYDTSTGTKISNYSSRFVITNE